MKVFFFYIGTPTPIHETELELIRRHDRLGDHVRILQCSGELPNCFWNQTHSQTRCSVCRSKFSNGWDVLAPGKNVELKHFPAYEVNAGVLPMGFDSVDEIKHYGYDGENIGYGAVSDLISIFRDHRFDTVIHRTEVLRELRTSIHVYETLKREFQEFKPDRVYIFNGRIATHLPAYLLCKKMGIDYVTYEVAGKTNSYRLLENRTVHTPVSKEQIDRLRSIWSKAHESTGESVLRQRRLGKPFVKVPAYTAAQVEGQLPRAFDKHKRNIAIFNSTIDEYAGIEGWAGKIYAPDETAGILRIIESFESDDRFIFYLRVHPHMKEVASTTSQLVDIRKLSSRFANLRVIWPDEDIDSYALMDACEKTLTFGSTIGLEAAYWGKPSILAGRAFYENLDCVYAPASHDELVGLLRADLPPRPADSALMYFYWEVSEGTPFTWFRETGMRNGLATGTFDGVEIKADRLAVWKHELVRFVKGATGALMHPSTALIKLKQYAKTIH